jgi:protocatechuate 3,4-dioxygenase, alpha subunit
MPDRSHTPGQTVGPFFHYALPYPGGHTLVSDRCRDAIQLHGAVYDGNHQPVPDALVELWQPDPAGNVIQRAGSLSRNGWNFTGWGRAATDATGQYSFTTLTPGSGTRDTPPYFALTVFARGLLDRLFTRAYLPMPDTATDALLAEVSPQRRHTLICETTPTGYRFDIHLQGELETVFLQYNPPPQ